jgi:hypothetical protein
MNITRTRWFAMTLVASLGIAASSVALAHVDVGVNIGIPGAVYAPEPVYAPPTAVVISPGWYGDRYYDGHRYWERREWEEHRPDNRGWHDARNHYDGHRGDWGHGQHGGGPRGDWQHAHQGDGGRGEH